MSIWRKIGNSILDERRKKKLIDIPMQSQLAVEIYLHIVLFLTLIILILYVDPFATLFSQYSLLEHQIALETLLAVNADKWPQVIFIIAALLFVSILFSHRIAGPHFKMKKTLQEYAKGDFREKMYLRENDYFRPIVPIINQFREKVASDLDALKDEAVNLRKLASKIPNGNKLDLRKELEESVDRMTEHLDGYKLSSQEKGSHG